VFLKVRPVERAMKGSPPGIFKRSRKGPLIKTRGLKWPTVMRHLSPKRSAILPAPRGGMTQVSRDAGLSRAGLNKFISGERSPGFDPILKILGTPGQKLQAGTAYGVFPGPTRKGSRTLHEGGKIGSRLLQSQSWAPAMLSHGFQARPDPLFLFFSRYVHT
jgi:hypothetical protein